MVRQWPAGFSITNFLNGPLMVRWFQGNEKASMERMVRQWSASFDEQQQVGMVKMVRQWSAGFSITDLLNGPLMVRWFQGSEKASMKWMVRPWSACFVEPQHVAKMEMVR